MPLPSFLESPALRSNLRQLAGGAAGYLASDYTTPLLEKMLPGEEHLNAAGSATERLVNMGLGAYLARPGTFTKNPNIAKLLTTKGLLFSAPVGIHHATSILGKTSDTFKGINKLTDTATENVDASGRTFRNAARAVEGAADQTGVESQERAKGTTDALASISDASKDMSRAVGETSRSIANFPGALSRAATESGTKLMDQAREGLGSISPLARTGAYGAGGALLGNLAAAATGSDRDENKNRRRRALWTLLGLAGGGTVGALSGGPEAAPSPVPPVDPKQILANLFKPRAA